MKLYAIVKILVTASLLAAYASSAGALDIKPAEQVPQRAKTKADILIESLENSRSTQFRPNTARTNPATAKKPNRATPKADLIVYLINEKYKPGIVQVSIRNIGKATSDSAILTVVNPVPGGGISEGSIPSMAPNAVKNIEIQLSRFSKTPKKGDRLKYIADSKNHVNESNENNNVKFFNL